MLQITYFYDSVLINVDNIVKPIQDALIGLVYVDDLCTGQKPEEPLFLGGGAQPHHPKIRVSMGV
jgi:hypothetical protein